MRCLTAAAAAPTRADPEPLPSTADRSFPRPTPRANHPLATRGTHQPPGIELRLDANRITAYRQHQLHLSQQEALPVSAKTGREGFARSGTRRPCPPTHLKATHDRPAILTVADGLQPHSPQLT